jgi:hypothetical protein
MQELGEAGQRTGSDLDTADSAMRDYWVPRRSAASAVAFRCCVLSVIQGGRDVCTVFMSVAYRTCLVFRCGPAGYPLDTRDWLGVSLLVRFVCCSVSDFVELLKS